MKLYYSPGACSLAPHIVLREAGLAFEPVRVDLRTHRLPDDSDFRPINPLGYVPVLELDDGTRLREVAALVQYLADQVPHKNLAPAPGTLPRYRLLEWLTFISAEIHKGFSPLFHPACPAEARGFHRARLQARLHWVDHQLDGKQYLMGERFGVADAYLHAVTRWAAPMQVDLSDAPQLQAFQQRMQARPAVQEALRAEGLA